MSPFLLLTGLLFFMLGGLALALPWRGVVTLVEAFPGARRPGATTYALLLIAPVVLLVLFVLVLLGPWESDVCRSLQDACLEQVTHWTLPTWVGLGLAAGCMLMGARAIRPYLVRRRTRSPLAALPTDLAQKWAQVEAKVERLCQRGLPRVRFVSAPRHACHVEGLLKSRLVLSEDVVRELAPDELVGVLAHELAHLRRGDLWWGACAFVCYCVLCFVPVGHRCYEGYLAARERAADDWAIARTGEPVALASALGKVRRLAEPDVPAARGGRLLVGRLQRLLSGEALRRSPVPTGSLGVGVALVAIAAPLLVPSLATLHHRLEPLGRGVLMALGIVS